MPKHGLITLIAVWSVLLLVPVFRPQSLRMSETAPTTEQRIFASTFSSSELEQLIDKHPRAGLLAREKLRVEFSYRDAVYWSALDAEITRLPHDLQLRRAKILDAAIGSLIVPFYQSDYKSKVVLPTQQERRKEAFKWLNQTQRAILLQQAREGARQAPNDGFFRWMEAVLLWNRDDEPALQALERAAQTSDFESGAVANQIALMRWKQTQCELDWDEKLNYLYATLLPHFAKFNELNREVTASGIAHYRRGDKAGAYRRWKIALEAAGAMRRAQLCNPHALILGLQVAEGLQTGVWSLVAREIGGLSTKTTLDQRLAAFVALARRDGQNALAEKSLQERADFQSKKIFPAGEFFPTAQNAYQSAMGFNRIDTRLQLQLPWLSRNIYWLSAAGAVALLICIVMQWLERRLHREFIGQVSIGQIAFFGALWLGFLFLAAKTRIGTSLGVLIGEDTSALPPNFASDFFDNRWLFWSAIAAMLALSLVFCYGQRALETRRLREQTLRRNGRSETKFIWPWILGIWSVVLATCAALMFPPGTAERVPLEWGWLFLISLALGLATWNIERHALESARKLRLRLALVSALAAATCGELALHFGFQNNWITDIFIVSSALWFVGLSLYLAVTEKTWRPLFARSLTTSLQTLGGVAAVCAVALLLASLAALPVRARQNRIVDDYIKSGEIDWMRNQPEIVKALK